jgi:hypothetical protein
MSVNTPAPPRVFCAGHRPATLLFGPMPVSIAFRVVRIAETQRQRRSFKPNLPIEHPQSPDPCALTASGTGHAKVKSP